MMCVILEGERRRKVQPVYDGIYFITLVLAEIERDSSYELNIQQSPHFGIGESVNP